MFENLTESLGIPSLYEKTKVPFWDDEHISKQMLKAHLDPNFEGASRTLNFIENSVDWISKIISPEKYKKLFDIGCGPGIYAERFEIAGYQVTGIDFSKRSIDYAIESSKRKCLDIDYVYQDYLEMSIDKKFDVATMIYCDYGALSENDRIMLMKKIYYHLRPGGKFLLDVFSIVKYNSFEEKRTWQAHSFGGFWSKDEYVELNQYCKYKEFVTLEQTNIISKKGNKVYYIWNTYFTKESLIKEAEEAGFKICEVFGDIAGKLYCNNSSTIAILLEK